jgi:hypothetical protein
MDGELYESLNSINEQDDDFEEDDEEVTPEEDVDFREDDEEELPPAEEKEPELPTAASAEEEEKTEEEDPEKQYLGKDVNDVYYYINKVESGWNVSDAEGKIVYPKESEKENVPTDNILDFIAEAQKELELTEVSGDIFQRYVQPALDKEQRDRDEADGFEYEDELPAEAEEESPVDGEEEEPFEDVLGEEEEERPITIESKVDESTEEMDQRIADMLYQAWQTIGADAIEAAGGEEDQEALREILIDALSSVVKDTEALNAFREELDKSGYIENVLGYLGESKAVDEENGRIFGKQKISNLSDCPSDKELQALSDEELQAQIDHCYDMASYTRNRQWLKPYYAAHKEQKRRKGTSGVLPEGVLDKKIWRVQIEDSGSGEKITAKNAANAATKWLLQKGVKDPKVTYLGGTGVKTPARFNTSRGIVRVVLIGVEEIQESKEVADDIFEHLLDVHEGRRPKNYYSGPSYSENEEWFKFMTPEEKKRSYQVAVDSGDFEGSYETFERGFENGLFNPQTGELIEFGGTGKADSPLRSSTNESKEIADNIYEHMLTETKEEATTCPSCDGKGWIWLSKGKQTDCPRCDGTGIVDLESDKRRDKEREERLKEGRRPKNYYSGPSYSDILKRARKSIASGQYGRSWEELSDEEKKDIDKDVLNRTDEMMTARRGKDNRELGEYATEVRQQLQTESGEDIDYHSQSTKIKVHVLKCFGQGMSVDDCAQSVYDTFLSDDLEGGKGIDVDEAKENPYKGKSYEELRRLDDIWTKKHKQASTPTAANKCWQQVVRINLAMWDGLDTWKQRLTYLLKVEKKELTWAEILDRFGLDRYNDTSYITTQRDILVAKGVISRRQDPNSKRKRFLYKFEKDIDESVLTEGVHELIDEVPGLTKDDREVLDWAIRYGKIENRFPPEAEMRAKLKGSRFQKTDLPDLQIEYLQLVLAPLAYEMYEKAQEEDESLDTEEGYNKAVTGDEDLEATLEDEDDSFYDEADEKSLEDMSRAIAGRITLSDDIKLNPRTDDLKPTSLVDIDIETMTQALGESNGEDGSGYPVWGFYFDKEPMALIYMEKEFTRRDGCWLVVSKLADKSDECAAYIYSLVKKVKGSNDKIGESKNPICEQLLEQLLDNNLLESTKMDKNIFGSTDQFVGFLDAVKEKIEEKEVVQESKKDNKVLKKALALKLAKKKGKEKDKKNKEKEKKAKAKEKEKKVKDKKKKVNEVKIVFNNHEFEIGLVEESESGITIDINGKQTFQFTPGFAQMFRDSTGVITDEGLSELGRSALSNLSEEFFEDLARTDVTPDETEVVEPRPEDEDDDPSTGQDEEPAAEEVVEESKLSPSLITKVAKSIQRKDGNINTQKLFRAVKKEVGDKASEKDINKAVRDWVKSDASSKLLGTKKKDESKVNERKWEYELRIPAASFFDADDEVSEEEVEKVTKIVQDAIVKFNKDHSEKRSEDILLGLDQVLAEFELVGTDEAEFDYAMEDLYDWADEYSVWVNIVEDEKDEMFEKRKGKSKVNENIRTGYTSPNSGLYYSASVSENEFEIAEDMTTVIARGTYNGGGVIDVSKYDVNKLCELALDAIDELAEHKEGHLDDDQFKDGAKEDDVEESQVPDDKDNDETKIKKLTESESKDMNLLNDLLG